MFLTLKTTKFHARMVCMCMCARIHMCDVRECCLDSDDDEIANLRQKLAKRYGVPMAASEKLF